MSTGAVEFLYRALDARVGIVIRTNDPTRMRARLYEARKSDPALLGLSVKPSNSNPSSELWILHKSPTEGAPDGSPETKSSED